MIDFWSTGTAAKRVEPCGAGERGRESEVVCLPAWCAEERAERERARAREQEQEQERESKRESEKEITREREIQRETSGERGRDSSREIIALPESMHSRE